MLSNREAAAALIVAQFGLTANWRQRIGAIVIDDPNLARALAKTWRRITSEYIPAEKR